ncbi:MAG: class I SAM-dependent methyltransferase [Candidatus Omnitrophota bacterium]|nr:MAG: class I SAM-dependent methyltransferase [Candidatus Omnitrophota bacterium]
MREFNALKGYPQPKGPRYVGADIRTIKSRIIASYRDERYYDGDRNHGYGGFKYDGRWKKIAQSMFKDYGLTENSALLQIGCEKGFLLHDFHEHFPNMKIRGAEMSDYAISHSMPSVKKWIVKMDNYTKLPFESGEFDFVIAIGVVYALTLRDAISCLREIQRVGKGKSFITLGAYKDERGEKLFKSWTVLGATILHVNEWPEVLKEARYTGDYHFMTDEYLNLAEKNG